MEQSADAIAIIGLSGRFPGATTVADFWRNIVAGRDSITRFNPVEMEDAVSPQARLDKDYVAARSVLDGVELFDAAFFGMKAREAELTDPQQRVFLEICWEAFEDAGYRPSQCPSVGVFAGASLNTYFIRHVLADRQSVEDFTSQFQIGRYSELLGALTDFVTTRVSYKLGLTGPSISVNTACSTSLTAVTLACQSLLLHQCDMALAGGVSITFPQRRGYTHLEGGMVAPDGTCRPYDAAAAGTVFGHGAGVVLLKRYDDAVRDGDNIYAVILGSGINNDGAGKVGFTAPSVAGQAAAMTAAYAMAGIDPETITYVEGHGTGTPLGDPIEVAALNEVLGPGGPGALPCHLGSVKANIGHVDAAAGVTGLIKVAMALREKKIPPLAHFRAPNPHLDLASGRLVLDREPGDWRVDGVPRRAAVNALGVGGTNVHVVLEEAPSTHEQSGSAEHGRGEGKPLRHILPVSARSQAALGAAANNLAEAFAKVSPPALGDAALTLQTGRETFGHRLAITAASHAEAIAKLRAAPRQAISAGERGGKPVRLALMFPGQGTQYPGMGRALYDASPTFRVEVDRGLKLASTLLATDLGKHLFPPITELASGEAIRSTVLAQPALFIIEHATATELMRLGARPAALIGHSLGEFVAAAIAGVMSYEDALRAVTRRAQLMAGLPPGAMLAVRMSIDELRARLPAEVDIAAINGAKLSVASGPTEAIEALAEALTREDVMCRRLHTSHAFHSEMMDPAVPELRRVMREIKLGPPRIAIASTVTGRWMSDEEATSPDYWAGHCRAPVKFADALGVIVDGGNTLLIETGPGSTLTALARQVAASRRDVTAASTLPGPDRESDDELLAEARAALWSAGVDVDCRCLGPHAARRTSLPTYPFERKRYFIDAPVSVLADPATGTEADTPERELTKIFEASDSTVTHSSSSFTQHASEQHTKSNMSAESESSHRESLARAIVSILADVSGEELAGASTEATFIGLGFDSLMLGQIAQRINKTYKTSVGFRQLMSTYPNVNALAAFLATKVAPAPVPPAAGPTSANRQEANVAQARRLQQAASPSANSAPIAAAGLEGLFRDQLAAMQRVIADQLSAVTQMPAAPVHEPMRQQLEAQPAPRTEGVRPDTARSPTAALPGPAGPDRFNTFMVTAKSSGTALTERQEWFIDDLAGRLEAKMPGSKAYTQRHRQRLADPRAASNFDVRWKEIVFPIVSDRAQGSRIWDVDGNSYIDVVNGFGQTAFGHNPPFVQEAIERQLKDGYPIGPQAHLAGEVTELICDMTGNERATFCNTGSEAVMAAMRVARAVTGRDKIVFFAGAYHGQFDEVLAKPGRQRSLPIAPGIPDGSLDNIVILTYGAPESVEWIRQNGDELAAVIVEPVQSRRPSFQPREFLAEVRAATESSGTALVFDEVVTGFRVHPGGMQAVYGIRADMATYGKVLGGGLPIGILAGKAKFLDALDGGQWRFGDDSVPEVAPTFFAGTFVRHPLTLAAARAVLLHMRERGSAELESLGQRTEELARRLNAELETLGIASRFEHYASWLWFAPTKETPLASLFFPYMRLLGIHVQEGFPWFMTTEHSTADFDVIARSVRDTITALQDAEIFTGGVRHVSAAQAGSRKLPPAEAAPSAPMREIYLAAQLGPTASCAFNEGLTLRLDGDLDVAALRASCADFVARHPALRASMGATGEAVRISPEVMIDVPLIDLAAIADPESRLAELIEDDQSRAFDLENGPLIRFRIIRLGEKSHVLIACGHHIVFDGWSAGVMIGELAELYNARRDGRLPALPEPATIAQALRPIAGPGSPTESYWLNRFKTSPEPLELPTDRPRPGRKSFRGATHYHLIDHGLVERIKRFSKANGVTPFATMLTGVQCFLARLTGQSDICVTVPMAGQQLSESGALVGHLVNFLPVRVDVDPARSPKAQALRVRDALLESYEHQDYTLGQLVARLGLPRQWDRTPITDVQFNLESEAADPGFRGLECRMRSSPKTAVNFDLFFNMVETGEGIRAEIDYSTDLFDEATIARWAGHLTTLLDGMTHETSPAATVGGLPLLSPAEVEWLRDGTNRTAHSFPEARTLNELISERAAQKPTAGALVHGRTSMSRGELDRTATAIAGQLAAMIPERGARIAVAVERSCELVGVLLAIWKAGHAFVPLDPSHPVTRLGQTMDVGNVAAVISGDVRILEAAPAGVQRIDVRHLTDAAQTGRTAREPQRLFQATDPESAAYVIFTSGSTGTPKGVEVSHRALVNFMTSMAEQPGMSEKDTLLAVTTVCFDIALLELFLPLLVGGTVVIADREQVVDGFALVELMTRSKTNVMQATPSLWQLLLEAGFEPTPSMRLFTGGEPLPRDLADALLKGGGELWNLYGPTETTIWSSIDRVERHGPITIGRPIANTELVIVDTGGTLVPVGVAGELLIGGAGLANGYLNRPDLTNAAYELLSLAGAPAKRYYHTGDIAVRLADGRIVLKGRRDQQVKLRGFRIELEEIETVLRSMDGIAAAAVCVVRDSANTERLAASLVTRPGMSVNDDEVIRHMRGRLPEYMVPTLWQTIDALPATANGKLDRKRLSILAADVAKSAARATKHVQPNTSTSRTLSDTEQRIAEAWSEVLGGTAPGPDDDVMALGIDSLRLFRVVAQLRRKGVMITAPEIFENPTISKQAAVLQSKVAPDTSVTMAPQLSSYRGGQRRARTTSS